MSNTIRASSSTRSRPRWYQTLVFRFGVVLTVVLVAFDLVLDPLFSAGLQLVGLGDSVAGVLLSAALALGVASLVAFALSRWSMGRLVRLSDAAADSVESGNLPGPFDESGHDEIAVIASTLNSLREQVSEHLKAFALQDIRKREWVAQVSHDLRTPLMAQIACLDRADSILNHAESSRQYGELRELISVAKMDADRVHILADDLLEIARLDAGDRLRLEPVPPGELIRQAVRGIEPIAAQKGISIKVDVTTNLPVLNADGRRLTRAIENFLRNAIRHASTRVTAIATSAGTNVRFEVRDDGRGLPKEPDFLDYLRRRSSEIRLTELAKRRRGDSAGLGLIVAQRVAEAHLGKIDAYNLSGGGAAFCLDIPVAAESTTPPEEPGSLSARARPSTATRDRK